jgi:hypothetical protein
MNQVIGNIGENKVNVDIKKNRMNEMDVFKPGGEFMNAFANFDNIFSNFKGMKGGGVTNTHNISSTGDLSSTLASIPAIANNPGLVETINNAVNQAMEIAMKQKSGGNFTYNYTNGQLQPEMNTYTQQKREPNQKMKETMEKHKQQREQRNRDRSERIQDHALYIIASFIDKTLSLLSKEEINRKVGEFKSTLDKNLVNHIDAYKQLKFKAQKISLDDVRDSLRVDRDSLYPLLYYASHLLKSNIVFVQTHDTEKDPAPKTHVVEYDSSVNTYIYMTDELEGSDVQFAEDRDGFKELYDSTFQTKISNIDIQKLKKMLVKDLKTLAIELKVDLSKTIETTNPETGITTTKKSPLLKEELVEKISTLINSSI